jgi:hypothetical protein
MSTKQRKPLTGLRKGAIRCAIYTRKSSEEGLEQEFNSLHAQREACEAYILSQKHEGWGALPDRYDDGAYSGGTMERPALQRLLKGIEAGLIDIVVVYKVDRLTRSLSDFARMVEIFDRHGVSFVSVTQQFNTTTSMGRLTLNVLLSFAQFAREVTGERIRDKIAIGSLPSRSDQSDPIRWPERGGPPYNQTTSSLALTANVGSPRSVGRPWSGSSPRAVQKEITPSRRPSILPPSARATGPRSRPQVRS